jgi:ribosomal protein S18 acetylase RimI-like enzyme
MNIRNGKASDEKNYLAVQKEAFPNIDSKRDSKLFSEKINQKSIFIAEEKKEYIGHICFGKHILNPPFINSVFIEELVIKKEYRGNGYGTKLIEKLVNYCKNKKIVSIHLGTGNTNGKAKRYYKKQGFKKVGFLKDIDPNSEYDCPQEFYAVLVKDWKKH